MLITSHAAAGAMIGASIKKPIPAFLAGFASHFLMDMIPHWNPNGEVEYDPDQPYFTEDFMRVARRDGVVGLASIPVYLKAAGPYWLPVAAGICGACLPDMNKPALVYLGFTPFPASMEYFHSHIQRESPTYFRREMVTAAVLVTTAVLTVRWLSRRGER